jgi:tryptophan-rich sensory protein
MVLSKAVFSILSVALTFIYAFGSSIWVSTGNNFYLSLKKPSWQPPDFIFGLIWPYNFLILILLSLTVISAGSVLQKNIWLISYGISIIFALTWARLFYVSENLIFSAVALSIAAIATIPMTYIAWNIKWWAGLLILPYQIWLIVAASLSFGYSILNRN